MTKGPVRARTAGHLGLGLPSSLGSRQHGGGTNDSIRRLLARDTANSSSRGALVTQGYLNVAIADGIVSGGPPPSAAIFPATVLATALPGLGFLVLEAALSIIAGDYEYPVTADHAELLPTGSLTPLIFPLSHGGGTPSIPYLCTGPGMVLDFATLSIPDANGQTFDLSYYYPALIFDTGP